jgi:hypothetical protein
LPYTSDLKTLPTYFQDETMGQSRVKNVNKVYANIVESGMFYAGPSEDKLTPIKVRTFEPPGSPAQLRTGEFELTVASDWNQTGQILIRQADPLPLEILYLAAEVAIGG